MRSPSPLVVRAAAKSAAALALLVPVVWCGTAQSAAASAPAASVPSCGRRGSPHFPIDARLYGGPAQYARGGGWRAWRLELRNTTRAECRAIHPIAILVDRAHALRPGHIRMEFLDPYADDAHDADGGRWRPVSFETTDEDENIGVFDDPFQGFTVPARGSVKVRVRSRFTGSAPTGPVTANVITMERRADDGDWVGQSGDYDFRIERAAKAGVEEEGGAGTGETREPRKDTPSTDGPSTDAPRTGERPGTGGLSTGEPESTRTGQGAGVGGRTGGPGKETPARTDATPGPRGEGSSRDHLPPELAATGRGAVLLGLAAISGVLVVVGAALVVRSRRPRW
ncbi:hypothetical protein [Streptomyces sp. ME19-01-6]|uniref:hypothetical protein n=1 Tax=Streptomyces sp. ME19-01-6 TaxID=3028686 RepID=UPI0029AD4226|nr:hypothetical protein [Streptomyces sp. ME19-01-6]MDX3233257.1 hypothetical protein [Streptomyces sp. ME19-01-6]